MPSPPARHTANPVHNMAPFTGGWCFLRICTRWSKHSVARKRALLWEWGVGQPAGVIVDHEKIMLSLKQARDHPHPSIQ